MTISVFSVLSPSTSILLMEKVIIELVRMVLVWHGCRGSCCGGDGLIFVGVVCGELEGGNPSPHVLHLL